MPVRGLIAALGLLALLGATAGLAEPARAQTTAAPEITSTGPFTVAEGATTITTLTATDVDTSPGDLTWSKTGGADSAAFTLSTGGALAFASAKDYEAPDDADGDGSYEVTVQVGDGTSMDTANLVVTLENVAELHAAVTGPATVSYAENGATRVATFSASSDADRDGIAWTIGGADSRHFSIDNPGGALRFNTPPDYESPADAGTNNGYSITVGASVGSGTPVTLDVTVTVTDADEPGSLSLSSARPETGSALTVTLADPDTPTGTVAWTWERNTGRTGWDTIGGATAAAYTPVAADAGRYLRVTATYADRLGSGRTARTILPNVVLSAHRLAGLTVTGGGTPDLYPAFSATTLHYATGCVGGSATDGSLTITLSAADPANTRVAVNGRAVAAASGSITVDDLHRESDIEITLSGADGSRTRYWIHCLDRTFFPAIIATKTPGASGIIEDLMMFHEDAVIGDRRISHAMMVDNNGVPRFRMALEGRMRGYFKSYPDATDPYARYGVFFHHGDVNNRLFVFDGDFQPLATGADAITTVAGLTHTDHHDFIIRPSGDYVLMSYEPATRDLSFLTDDYNIGLNAMATGSPPLPHLPCTPGTPDCGSWASSTIKDSVIQIRSAAGAQRFLWNSWGAMAIEDCMQHRFPSGYAHINSFQWVADGDPGDGDDDLVASFRGCSKVLRIDTATGDVVWRLGHSIWDRGEWEAGSSSGSGPAPLEFVNDPQGGFCGQHAAQILDNGHLLLYDNGVVCVTDPISGESARTSGVYSRVVEYAIDTDNHEAVYVREHSQGNAANRVGYAGGNVSPLPGGDWLISWGGRASSNPTTQSATQVDPDTHAEKFNLKVLQKTDSGTRTSAASVWVTPIHPVALAQTVPELTASLPPSGHTSIFHGGAGDAPRIVVAFSRPIADFDATSPSLSVSGATVASVAAHAVAGEAANAYLIALTPDGAGDITFSLVAGQACASGGICAADGTTLGAVPAALVIGAPPTVVFEQSAYTVPEGLTLHVAVRLSAAHRGVRGLTVPVLLDTAGSASSGDLTVEESATFGAGETRTSLRIEATADDLVEGPETATLRFGALTDGVTPGTTATSTVTVTDTDRAHLSFSAAVTEVAEGGEVALTFSITNGITFARDQAISLTLGGTATPVDDFILLDANNQALTAPYTVTFPAATASATVTVRAVDDADIEAIAETVTVSARLDLTSAALGTLTITIPPSDVPDAPVVSLLPPAASAVPEGTDVEFRFFRTSSTNLPLSRSLTVPVRITAVGSTLSGAAPASVTFPADSPIATLSVATLDDEVVEPPGSVRVLVLGSASNPPAYLTSAANTRTVAVTNNDVAAFTISASEMEVAEGSSVTVTVAAEGVTFAEPQEITFVVGGTAAPGEDFTIWHGGEQLADPYAVALPAGATTVRIDIRAARDGEADEGETVELTANHEGRAAGSVALTITAPLPPPVVIVGPTGGGGGGGGGGGPSGPTPSTVDFEWTVKEDIEELDPGHGTPTGMWSDGATLWLLENGSGADDAVYAYNLESGERVEGREFELGERNRAPRGIWSDRETAWVSDSGRDRLFAHDLASGERLEERDLELARENRDARGVWSGGGTMWVLDGGRDGLFAYGLESGAFLAGYALDAANGDPHGLWSDGVTLWVSNHEPKRLFAYRLPAVPDEPPEEPLPLEREDDLDFTTLSSASNNSPRGVWSDGSVMYVADELDARVYSYNMPDAIDARLASLALEDVDIGAFDPRRTDYEGVIAGGVTETTVEAAAVQRRTQVVIDPPDADGDSTNGHQVALAGVAEITVTVTSADGSRTRVYRVDLGSDEPDEPWPHCLLGDVAAGFSLVVYEGGAVEDLAACAESRNVVALYALHEGVYLPLIPGAPGFVNEAFRELYPEGVPALTALVAASAGPPGSDPVGDLGAPRSWPRCLRGELAEGFSLLVYEGGSIEDLAACAERLAVTALYALEDGQWVSYIPGAPGFVNEPFRELFAGGVPPVTPLVVRSDGPPPTGSDGDGAEGNSE